MKVKAMSDNRPTDYERDRLRALAVASDGLEWGSPEVTALSVFYRAMDLPWHVHSWVGGHHLERHDMGGKADAAAFIAGMRKLADCIDYGSPPNGECPCAGCHRNRRRPLHQSWPEQQAWERLHGLIACERGPRFEGEAA